MGGSAFELAERNANGNALAVFLSSVERRQPPGRAPYAPVPISNPQRATR